MPRAALSLHLTAALLCGSLALATPPATVPAASTGGAETCALPTGPLPTRTRAVFVLDTSGSMRGIGDGQADIFGQVKASVSAYVAAAQPDRVDLVTFDGGLRTRRGYALPTDADTFARDLAALRANGSNTYLYRSLRDALSPLAGGGRYLTDVFLLTDGIDNNPRRRVSAGQALAAFRGRGPLDRLTYIALGTEIPAEAATALARSGYARGLSLPVGTVPDLTRVRGTVPATVTDPARVPAPYPDGTPLRLVGAEGGAVPTLAQAQASGGLTRLQVRGEVPQGTAALLCAESGAGTGGGGDTATAAAGTSADPLAALPPQRVLLTLNLPPQAAAPQGWLAWVRGLLGRQDGGQAVQGGSAVQVAASTPATPGWQWLNPGADRVLGPGEDTVLRYRAAPGTDLRGARLELPGDAGGAAADLTAALEAQPGASEFAVRLRRTGSGGAGQEVAARLILASGETLVLPGVTAGPLASAGQTVTLSPVGSAPTAGAPSGTGPTAAPAARPAPRWAGWVLGVALLLGLLAALALLRRRRAGAGGGGGAAPRGAAAPPHAFVAGTVPTVEGLTYKEDRTLALVMAGGELSSVPTPLGGPFDIGLLSRVPHLSGVRAEQHRDGLRLLHVPEDLDIRRGGRLLRSGDVVVPGTLLGVAMADASRAPHPPLGSLVGLGLPLSLRAEGVNVQVAGPYATHALSLPTGITDLGEAFGSPALRGLKVSVTAGRILLADLPPDLTLSRAGDPQPLRPGTYLPAQTDLGLPER
ncbi:vWA domain-containing protein [Deinococcus gobiensis]|uniref:vWA domain-containing protein n=1 Tax=Deinococcus gobiensis TaxID=502394 RepID=UPI0002EC10B0|nr:vWA domain-containing protein [Deinococcus gobiensis]